MKITRFIPYFTTIIALAVSFSYSAQSSIYTKTFTTSNGLLSNDNYMSYQDKQGYIWICSEKGIVKYDGLEFKSFTIKDGLPINDIWYINEDSQGRLWLSGFFKGLYYIKNDVVSNYPGADSYSGLIFSQERGDSLFFFTKRGYNNYAILPSGKFESIEVKTVTRKAQGNNQSFQIQMVDHFDIDSLKGACFPILGKKSSITSNYHSLLSFSFWNQRSLVATKNWLLFNNDKAKVIDPRTYFAPGVEQLLLIQPSGELVVHFGDSLHVYSDPMTKQRNHKLERLLSPLESKKIGWITKDDEENLWVSLFRSNVVLIPNDNQTIKRHYSGLNDDYFSHAVLLEQDETPLFLTKNGHLYRYWNNLCEPWSNGIPNEIVNTLTANEHGAIVSYSNEQVVVNGKNQLNRYIYSRKFNGFPLSRSLLLSDSTMICGNFVSYSLENGLVKSLDASNRIEGRINDVISIREYIVSGSTTGTFSFNRKKNKVRKLTNYETQSLFPFEDKLLIGTNGAGLILLDFEGKVYSKKHIGLSINSIQVKGDQIYLGTNKGIYIDVFDSTKNEFKTIKVVDDSYGLSSNEVTSLVFKNEELFAGTVNGFNQINVQAILKGKRPAPKIRLTQVLVNSKKINMTSASVLNWDENDVEFKFTGISFYSLGKVDYKYRLVGLDDKWVRTSKRNIRFRSLPAGKYTFQVAAFSSVGIQSTSTATFNFEIKKHFTATLWFRLGLILIIGIAAIAIGYFYRNRKVKRLEIEKRFSEIEMNALRSQMNPHFIFNSLNTLQSMLFLKGQEETNKYISEFSKLMRLTLDHSKTQLVSLEEELSYLDLYIRLEKHRLDGRLEYTIDIDDTIDQDEIQLPSMLIQPVVENAILHGLIPKKENRVLELKFGIKANKLIIEINDNGIGRKASKERKRESDNKSWGTSILQERIEVLNKLNNYKIEFSMHDLLPAQENTGTQVIIKLPFNGEA